MSQEPNNSAINPLPPILWLLALPAIAVEIVLNLGNSPFVDFAGAIGWRNNALTDYGFFAPVQKWMLATGQFPGEHLIRYLSYPFVHHTTMQAVFALVFLLALGNMVARVFSSAAVLVLFFGAAIFGAGVYGLLVDSRYILAGGFPAVYGLIGAYSFLLWVNLAATGGPRSQAFTLIAFLMGIQLLFGMLFGGPPDWVADLAGFGAGFGLSFLVCPGGWRQAVALIRRR